MKTITIAVVTLSLTMICSGRVLAQSGNDLYQQALVKERVEADVQGAIELYQHIITEFAEDRPLAAKALVQMGECYEKLGQQEAREAYLRVIREYGDQVAQVALARERLAALSSEPEEPSPGPSFRKIEIASKPQNGVLSPDGARLAFASEGSIWILPLQGNVTPDMAGEPTRLTASMGAWNSTDLLAWSGNGERIAFSAAPEGPEEIYVVSVATGELRKIPGNHFRGNKHYDYRLSLSPDGGTLAYVHMEREGSTPDCPAGDLFVHTIPVEGGELTRLAPVCTREPTFSPDGKHVAYIRLLRDPSDPERTFKQLWVAPVAGGTPELLLDSAQVRGPVWSADGRMIAVLADGEPDSRSQSVWVASFPPETGQPRTLTRFRLPRRSDGLLAGWTPDEKLGVFLRSERHQAVYTARVDGGKAVQLTPDAPESYFPRWSPDGAAIVFTSLLHSDGDRWNVVERSVADTLSTETMEREDYLFGLVSIPSGGGPMTPIRITGDSRVIPGVPPGGGIHVSPDGKTILFAGILYHEGEPGSRPKPEVDIWTVPWKGGEPTRLVKSTLQDRWPCWSPDGKRVAFLRYEFVEKGLYAVNIHVIPVEGGEPNRITSNADSVDHADIGYSPDGSRIAFFSTDGAIKAVPSDGGKPEVLIPEVPQAGRHRLAWSPDGRRIAYTAAGKIWLASVMDGESVELQTGLQPGTRYGDFGWSPDGEKLTFLATRGGEAELWLVSDFLPASARR
jgi:Tol biopolymer transport system component